MHYRHLAVLTGVLCSAALCFGQAQTTKSAEVKNVQIGQTAITKSLPDTAKKATPSPTVVDTAKTVKTTDSLKTTKKIDSAKAVQLTKNSKVDTAKTIKTADSAKTIKKTDSVKIIQSVKHSRIDTSKSLQVIDTGKAAIQKKPGTNDSNATKKANAAAPVDSTKPVKPVPGAPSK